MKQPIGFIYITTNLINNKKYIGLCSYRKYHNPDNYFGSGKAIKSAIKKYGKDNFIKEYIFFCFSITDLNWAERHFITEFNAVNNKNYYNISPGGRSSLGFTGKKHSENYKERMSDIMKTEIHGTRGKKLSQVSRERMSIAKKGVSNHSVKQLKIISEIGKRNRGMKRTDEQKRRLSISHLGKKLSPEQRAKISERKTIFKNIVAISPDNKKVCFKNIDEICKKFNFSYYTILGNLSKTIPINRGPAKGWKFLLDKDF